MSDDSVPAQSVPDGYSQTRFVTEEIDTTVDPATRTRVREALTDAVAGFRDALADEQTAARLLTGDDTLREADTAHKEDPEPLTKRAFLDPLFEALGYDDLAVEVGDRSDSYGKKADYAASFDPFEEIDSGRLLIEAEPVNKRLRQDRHGLGQVEDWLSYRPFDATFGVATNGLQWTLVTYDADSYTLDTLADVDLHPVVQSVFDDQTGRNTAPSGWTTSDTEQLLDRFLAGFAFDNVVSVARDARASIRKRRTEITDQFYDDYVRLVFGQAPAGGDPPERSLIGDGVDAPEAATGDDVRLFAVELLNRLVFVKFLEDRGLVEEGLLERIVAEHDETIVPRSLYETYLEPLFFGVFDEPPGERDRRIQTVTQYSELPYLNGGLFRPTEGYDGAVDDTEFDVSDSVMRELLLLLERYEFSTTGGPGELDPSVLGNVFEKTINYITTATGDQKKQLGAYYTPDEITRFCAEQTVLPGLRDEIAAYLRREQGYTEAMLADDVFTLIDTLPPNVDLVEELIETVVDDFRALDPACGSGHFLTSVESEIVRVRKALYDVAYGALPDDDPRDETPPTWRLRKRTVVENIYGVDIVEPATEIAKLRLWLSIVAAVEPDTVSEYDEGELALPNIVFSIQQGNSLIGFTDLVETTGGDGSQSVLDNWTSASVRERYEDVIEAMDAHAAANDTSAAKRHLEAAERRKNDHRPALNEKIHQQFREAGVDVSLDRVREYDPFHWVLEFAPVYADGGFDAVVGNPPWEMLQPRRDEFFSRYEPTFRSLDPSRKDELEAELRDDPEIQSAWTAYEQNIQQRATYFTDGPAYSLQWGEIDGQTRTGRNDLSTLFLERVFDLTNEDGHVAKVLPNKVFSNASAKRLRSHLLEETTIGSVVGFENKGIFGSLHDQFQFTVLAFRNGGHTESFRTTFGRRRVEVLDRLDDESVSVTASLVRQYSPEGLTFPKVSSRSEVDVLRTLLDHEPVGESVDGSWWADGHIEIYTRDSAYFSEDRANADYPVYGGSNVHQFVHDDTFANLETPDYWSVAESRDPDSSAKARVREKNVRQLKDAIYRAFDGAAGNKSKKTFVNDLLKEERGEPLQAADVLLDCTEYRVVYRNITNARNERTLIATVLPPGVICYHALTTIRPYRIEPSAADLKQFPLHGAYERAFTDRELFVVAGLLNSIPFDSFMRTRVDTNVARYKFENAPVPHLTAGDDWFDDIATRAARLNCYGDAFEEMRDRLGGIEPATAPDERERLRAGIDAAACHAYGLDRAETAFLLEDFHRVESPRLMTEAYFDRVLELYDRLATQ